METNPGLGRTLTMSSSQARLASATERPSSPTKGMGGFVQSAMMKRSDSVNKRWSAQPGPNMNRQNSAASSRSGHGGLTGSYSMPKLEPMSSSREGSNEPSSRPSSSSSNLTILTVTQARDDKDVFVKPALPHNRSRSVLSTENLAAADAQTSPPSSPSKRWSPTKSSWLESSITKPDSPKPTAARNSQPSWMADIAKAKAERASNNNTPKPVEDGGSRSASPTKETFGQGILKHSDSRDLGTSRTQTPMPFEDETPRSASPVKKTFGQTSATRSESRDLSTTPKPTTSAIKSKPDVRPEKTATPPPRERSEVVPSNRPNEPVKEETSPKVGIDIKDHTKPTTPSKKPDLAKSLEPVKSPAPSSKARSKPETPPKPQTDFRSNLRSRQASEAKQKEAPEFLSKFGNLKKSTPQNYVAPDVLKNNILRGKGDLAKTDGPLKTQRRDELKESLLAKKDQWKKEKDEGVVHERKTSNPPQAPQKPEALAKRELLGRSESTKAPSSPEKPKTATPEALARQRSLRGQTKPQPSMPALQKQTSAPASRATETAPVEPRKQASIPVTSTKPTEASKLAARFNPALAGVLARGPPPDTNGSSVPSRNESPALPERSRTPAVNTSSESPAEGEQLEDMRKGRAKGPKRRKGGVKDAESETAIQAAPERTPEPSKIVTPQPVDTSTPRVEESAESAAPVQKPKPRALPGSAASIMMSSLQKSPAQAQKEIESYRSATPFESSSMPSPKPALGKTMTPAKSPAISSSKPAQDKPAAPAKSPALSSRIQPSPEKPTDSSVELKKPNVPEFRGFGSLKKSSPAIQLKDNKENAGEDSKSVKSATLGWGQPSPPKNMQPPAQIQLPSKKDEEAAMRSAGLLASSSSRPSSRNGLGISVEKSNGCLETPPAFGTVPPKPTKPSRSVSGQLQGSSPNKGLSGSPEQPKSETERLLIDTFGSIPRSNGQLSIDTLSVIANTPHQDRVFRTVRKSVHLASPDGTLKQLPPQQEYTFFDESLYICTHAYTTANGPKKTEVFLWAGNSSPVGEFDQTHSTAKRTAREAGNAFVNSVQQGFEPPGFLQALGGILVSRRGSRDVAPKRYMLCGRKHLGQIAFDEVDFGVDSLCAGYAYLISYPMTLQETKLYLWKGSACSTEEVSAARLAAMDLSETGEMIEVDQGAEFASFLKIFGPGTTKASIPKASQFWQQKALAPDNSGTRLFRVQQAEPKSGFLGTFFNRRPSWNNLSPARRHEEEIKVEAKEISPFMQSDLEADSIYLLDAYSELYVLIGPLFASQAKNGRDTLLTQALLLASEYATLATSTEQRPAMPNASVLFSDVPRDWKMLFRYWDDDRGLLGTDGLMMGSQASRQNEVRILGLDEVLGVVRGS